ncbi:MAG: hypothetical protein P1V20_09535 [Verrucomicrobiales bacterium]|nr:hypothetical protein [Verrucomicrobiales bacterium]
MKEKETAPGQIPGSKLSPTGGFEETYCSPLKMGIYSLAILVLLLIASHFFDRVQEKEDQLVAPRTIEVEKAPSGVHRL